MESESGNQRQIRRPKRGGVPRFVRTRTDTSFYHSYGNIRLKGEIRERWQQLCERAAEEQDPGRLMELVDEINRLLAEKELRLKSGKVGQDAA